MGRTPNESNELLSNMWWTREAMNPVLSPTGGEDPDGDRCMNPCVVRMGERYRLYYSGGNGSGFQSMCMASASIDDPTVWDRHGIVLEHGREGEFDYQWVVLPHVVKSAGEWRLYYTGNRGYGEGLSAFAGIGLAYSHDGKHFERHSDKPILGPSADPGAPDTQGVAGGSVIEIHGPDGDAFWRFYYTGCPTLGSDVFLNQQKVVCYADSIDGIDWEKKGAIMFRNPDRDYIDVAAAGPVVWQESDGGYRMMLSAIGTRWGYYSICYAESDDGLLWRSGSSYGDDLVLGPQGNGWDRQMVEYPSVVRERYGEEDRLRLFYCGNGYGQTGIGTAVEAPLRARGLAGKPELRVSSRGGEHWLFRIPSEISCDFGPGQLTGEVKWQGPTGEGMIWHETDITFLFAPALRMRVIVKHVERGLEVTLTVMNGGAEAIDSLHFSIVIEGEIQSLAKRLQFEGIGAGETESMVLEVSRADGTRSLKLNQIHSEVSS